MGALLLQGGKKLVSEAFGAKPLNVGENVPQPETASFMNQENLQDFQDRTSLVREEFDLPKTLLGEDE